MKTTTIVSPHTALSPKQVLRIANAKVPNTASFKLYSEITELPRSGHAFAILIRSTEQFGHYVALINHGSILEWYDSYSYMPDRELKWQSRDVNVKLGQDIPIVSNLMREFCDNGGRLEYNEFKFQNERNENDESCGYHTGVRILFNKMPLPQYQSMLKRMAKANKTIVSNIVIKIGTDVVKYGRNADIVGEGETEENTGGSHCCECSNLAGGKTEGGSCPICGGFFELSTSMPKVVKDMLNKFGDKRISRVQVARVPLKSVLQKVLNVVTMGSYQQALKDKNYDTFFHLYLVIFLEDGTKILLEKNQRVGVKTAGSDVEKTLATEGTEVMTAPPPNNVTLREFVERVDEQYKNNQKRLWQYDAITANCQFFVMDVLRSNKISTTAIRNFVMQDVSTIVQKNGILHKLVNFATDTANRIDTAIKGGGERGEHYISFVVLPNGRLQLAENVVRD